MPQPRRTKRCDTCRDRRIRCDENRPRCGQCTKGRRRCVVSEEILISQCWTTERISTALETTAQSPSYSPYQEFSISNQNATARKVSNTDTEVTSLNLTHIWWHFLRLQLPSMASNTLEDHHSSNFDSSLWQTLAQMDTSSQFLKHALGAVASARVGQIEGNRMLCDAAGRLYGIAVSKLREEIGDGTRKAPIDVVATVLALAAYEFYQDTSSGFGYISHAQGAGKLIESLGPDRFISGISHKLFLNFRELGVIHAILGRKATFLATADWSNQPWNIHEKCNFDKLLDIAVLIPGFYDESYKLKPSSDPLAYILRLELIDRYWEVHDKLSLWYTNYMTASDLRPYVIHNWNQLSQGQRSLPISQGPFSSQLHFRNVETARCLVFYWSFMCCVSSGITWEHRALFGRGTDYKTCPTCSRSVQKACLCDYKPPTLQLNEADMRQPPGLSTAFANADNIAMSIPYLLQKGLKGIGAEICVWPLRIIHEVYRFRDEKEKVWWALNVFKELEHWGISWSTSLLEMQFPDYRSQTLLENFADEHSEIGSKDLKVSCDSPMIEIQNFTVI